MNDIEKLFKKISKKERTTLRRLIEDLLNGSKNINIDKFKNSDFYKVRKGNFRIIFHYDSCKNVIIDSIRLRRENTYKGF